MTPCKPHSKLYMQHTGIPYSEKFVLSILIPFQQLCFSGTGMQPLWLTRDCLPKNSDPINYPCENGWLLLLHDQDIKYEHSLNREPLFIREY